MLQTFLSWVVELPFIIYAIFFNGILTANVITFHVNLL